MDCEQRRQKLLGMHPNDILAAYKKAVGRQPVSGTPVSAMIDEILEREFPERTLGGS